MADDKNKTTVTVRPRTASASSGNDVDVETKAADDTEGVEEPIDTDDPYGLKGTDQEALYVEGNQIKNANGDVKGAAPKTVVSRDKKSTPMSMARIAKHAEKHEIEDNLHEED